MRHWLLIVPFVVACGGSSPVGPGPSSITLSGTLTDTVSGAQIGTYSQTVASLPARLTLTAPGHLPREARIISQGQAVDLIPDAAPFDVEFYRQFARGTIDGPAQPLRVLSTAPSIYLQTAGLSAANVAALEQAAREAVSAFTGGRFAVQTWETGADARPEQAGWIVVELVNDPALNCGRGTLGGVAHHIWLNLADRCSFDRYSPTAMAHEIGHTLGFSHVTDPAALMFANAAFGVTAPNARERYHAAIAYKRAAGNRDLDVD